jgi:deazaflavin-dependent oxidoreductase (nitroreductase family)
VFRWSTFVNPDGDESTSSPADYARKEPPPMSVETSNMPGRYEPSPSDRVREQVARYESTNGKEGGTLEGRPVVILTSKGAKTGKIRKTPLIRIEQDGTYAVVASNGGAPRDPSWYLNVIADPLVQLQDGEKIQRMKARELSGDEKARWWSIADERWPHFPEYRAKAPRYIPILALEPVPSSE